MTDSYSAGEIPAPANSRAWSGFRLTILLSALTAVTSLSIDMNLPAMPVFQKVFHVSVASAQLTLSLFLAGYAIGQFASGSLSDRIGRKPVLMYGLGLFCIASLLCCISPSMSVLVCARFVQGLGASVGPIMGRAIVRDLYPPREAAGVLSQITQVMIVSPVIAPSIGGILLSLWGWRAIFVLLICSGILLWWLCFNVLAESVREKQPEAGRLGFMRQGLVTVVSDRSTRRHILTACFSYSGMFAYVSSCPFVYGTVFHLSDAKFGICFAISALSLMVGASVNRKLLVRRSPGNILRLGVILQCGAGFVLAALSLAGYSAVPYVLLPMMFYMAGMGLVVPNATALARAPHGKLAGLTASLVGGLQTSGGALAGMAVNFFFRGTTVPMALGVAVLGLLTAVVCDRSANVGELGISEDEIEAELALHESGI